MSVHTLKIAAAILAGGLSSRMAVSKAGLDIGGRSMLDRELEVLSRVFGEVLVVCKDTALLRETDARMIADAPEFAGRVGPMTGIYSALKACGGMSVFVTGCDMPFIRPDLLRFMASLAVGERAVVPVVGGLFEPLFAIYPPGALQVARGLLESGEMKLSRLIGGLDVIEVREEELRRFDPELTSFTNVNTPAELERARELASGGAHQEGVAIGR